MLLRLRSLVKPLALVFAAGATGAFFVLVALNLGVIGETIRRLSLEEFALVTVVQLLVLLARAWMWETCVRASGARTAAEPLHVANALVFLSAVVLPAQMLPPIRIWSLKTYGKHRIPNVRQMIFADMVVSGVGVGVVFAVIIGASLAGRVPWWNESLGITVGFSLLAGLIMLRRMRWVRDRLAPLRPLLSLKRGGVLLVISALAIAAETWRFSVVLSAAGFHLQTIDALGTFSLTSLVGSPVPIGPGMSPFGHHGALRAHHALAEAAGAGILLALSAALAAAVYLLVSSILVRRQAEKSESDSGAD